MTEKTWYLVHRGTRYPLEDHAQAVLFRGMIARDNASRLGAYLEFTPSGTDEEVRIEPLYEAEIIED